MKMHDIVHYIHDSCIDYVVHTHDMLLLGVTYTCTFTFHIMLVPFHNC